MIFYTFRTNKNIGQFLISAGLSLSTPVFIINKPNQDIPNLLDLIKLNKPDWVIGFASVKKGQSRWEQFTANKFGSGRVSKNFELGAKLNLNKPDFLSKLSEVKMGQGMSASFCGAAAFRIQEFIERENLNVNSGFLHLKD
jgi:hypothetical protein